MIPERIDRSAGTGLATIHRHPWSLARTPILGPRGLLTFGDNSVCLSERNAQLAGVLVYHFGSELSDVELLHRVWPEGATVRTLRRHLRRLDRRLARVGLTIVDNGYRSHALLPVDGAGAAGTHASSADEEYGHLGVMHEPVRHRAEQ